MVEDTLYERLSKERKTLQIIGELPEWITTPSYQLLKEKYLINGESLLERYSEIALAAAMHLPTIEAQEEYYKIFFDLMWKGWLAPSTPVLTSMGRANFTGCPVSCSGSEVQDSVFGFYAAQLEEAVLSKNGFGTSSYLGLIRPRGASISNSKGKASGVLPVFKDMVQVATDISQGASRRGAWAGYLDIDHGDFYELSDYVRKFPDDANVGWIISNDFINRLEAGDQEAIGRYQRTLKLKMLTGKGYYFFKDKVNNQNPPWFKDKGIEVKASNLCVVPETKILTDKGYIPIIDLADQQVNIWNGESFSKSLVRQTGTNQKILKVITSHGQELEATRYHVWYRLKNYHSGYEKVTTEDLKPGDKLIKFELPVIEGSKILENAYQNGFYSGDGCLSGRTQLVYFYGEKRKLTKLFNDIEGTFYTQEEQDRVIFRTRSLKDKFFVPLENYDINSRLNWLAGICDSDGSVSRNGENESIQIGSINKNFLLDIQEMLQTLGVASRINVAREEGYNELPRNDGTGLNKAYLTKQSYRLLINSNSLYKLLTLGFTMHRLKVNVRLPNRESMSYNTVVEVRDEDRLSDTYCFNEPIRHMGMFGGILTGNCTETTLPTNPSETFTCVLSSMNFSKYDEFKDTDAISDSVIFLYCVALEFMRVAKDIPGLEASVRFTEKYMALGLGTLGFHTYLQEHMIPFESMDAHFRNVILFRDLRDKAERANRILYTLFGECEATAGHKVACSHLTAIAPNLSSALICGGVSQGIEPVYKNAYIQNTAAGKIVRVNPTLLKIINKLGLDVKETVKEIIDNNGSVQSVDWLSEKEKKVFLTAFEINQFEIIRLANIRQIYITQAQSINLFFSANESEELISSVHKKAFLSKNIKSLYYIRSETGVKVGNSDCKLCEG